MYLGGQSSDAGVGDSLRDDGEADGDPGDEVGQQEVGPVLGQPGQDRQLPNELLLRESRADPS